MAILVDATKRDEGDYLWDLFADYFDTVRSGERPVEVTFTQSAHRVFPALLGTMNAGGETVTIDLNGARPGLIRRCLFAGRSIEVRYECRSTTQGTAVSASVCTSTDHTEEGVKWLALVIELNKQLSVELLSIRDRLDARL